jgi:pSer/pThr/pTyr-binding forkhead associated (FHA) protein
MFAIAVNTLYTTLRRRGTTRQLAGAIVTCVISALLLLPAIVWYNARFNIEQATISVAEIEVALVYVALFGWFLPLSVTVSYCLFSLPRTSTTALHIPRQKRTRTTRANAATALNPPRHQPGVAAPFVFGEDTPWGWLVYRGGRFQGQRLALKRTVVTIGRGEDNDIWLDDDMASRNHAELAWDGGQVYITDCESLNGVLLNGQRIRASALIEPGELLEIGAHRFLLEKAEQTGAATEQDDPLLRHVWHSSASMSTDSEQLSITRPPESETHVEPGKGDTPLPPSMPDEIHSTPSIESQVTAQLNPISSSPQAVDSRYLFMIRDGEKAGQSFALDRPVMTIGRGSESEVIINDTSISRRHAQILRQSDGIYVQDLASRNGTMVNDKLLHKPQLLEPGDIVCVGNIHLEYTLVPTQQTTPLPPSITTPPSVPPLSSPLPLRLPSKPKQR